MIAYELGKRAGDREIEEMIKTLPNNRQKSIVQNDAVAPAFEACKARAEKLRKMRQKQKKPVRLKNRSLSRAKKAKMMSLSLWIRMIPKKLQV